MPSSLSASMLTELQGQARVQVCIEFTIDGTQYNYSDGPVNSESEGTYSPYIVSMNGFTREANVNELTIIIPRPNVTIFDHDRVIQKLVGSSVKDDIVGSTVECYIRSDAVTAANHYKFFSGVIADFGLSGNRKWNFILSPDVSRLESKPLRIPYLTKQNFPTAPSNVIGQPLWVVYGKHSSVGVSNTAGMISALPAEVDGNGDSINWILAVGQMTIDKLYLNGTDDTSNWGFWVLDRDNIRYQMAIYQGGGTEPVPSDTVRVDCTGLFIDGPGDLTSGQFTNPAECIRHFMANFVFVDEDSANLAAWETESNYPIATTIMDAAETYFDNKGIVMAKVISGDDLCKNIIESYCKSFNSVPMWDDQFRLGTIPEDETDTDLYHDDRHIAQKLGHALSDLKMDTRRFKSYNELIVNYLLAEADGTLTQAITLIDTTAPDKVGTLNIDFGNKSIL